MPNQFYEKFRDYSTIQLLQIRAKQDDYQPAAVAAALQLLEEREVRLEDMIAIQEQHFREEFETTFKKEREDKLKTSIRDFFKPDVQPGKATDTQRWINIILAAVGGYFLWLCWLTLEYQNVVRTCPYCVVEDLFLVHMVSIVWTGLVFFLMLYRKRWGWILLFADITIMLGLFLPLRIAESFQEGNTLPSGLSYYMILLYRFVLLALLLRQPIMDYLHVTPTVKKNTFVVIAIIVATGLFYHLYPILVD